VPQGGPNPNTIVMPNDPTAQATAGYDFDVFAGDGNDTVSCSYGDDTVLGSAAASSVLHFIGGVSAASYVQGGGGTIIADMGPFGGYVSGGAAGGNILVSQTQAGLNSELVGVTGGDQLFASANGGTDLLQLGAGTEYAVGGDGNMTVQGGSGHGII